MVEKTSLTDLKLRNLPVPATGQKITWDALPGLGVRVSCAGSRTFLVKHKNQFITLGRYPVLSLAEARAEYKRIKAEFTLGRLRPRAVSYAAAVDAFLEERKPHLRPNTIRSYTRHLKCFHFSTKVAELTQHDLARQLKPLATRPAEHNHVVGTWIIFFGWCVKRQYITTNPAIHLPQFPKVSRSRVLTTEELKAVWTAAGQIGGNFGMLVRCLILMGQRVTETASIQTSWINFNNKTICLPATITKSGREHTFPIGTIAAALLSTLLLPHKPTSLLFAGRGTSSPFKNWSKDKPTLDKLSGVSGWVLHDIRRSYRTNLARLRVPPHIAERLVNHTSSRSAVETIYDHHTYLDEMREAVNSYERWFVEHVLQSNM